MKAIVKLNEYKNNKIKISGSKNSSLPIIACSLLCDEEVVINNIPNIDDVNKLINIVHSLNFVSSYKNNTFHFYPNSSIKESANFIINHQDICKLRGSYYLIGTFISLMDKVSFSISYPGGCNFSLRPINYHLDSFKRMGINNEIHDSFIYFYGEKMPSIHHLPYKSLGTTINIILASCKTSNKTVIYNASIEPEVIDLCNFINSMGGNISISDDVITIVGVLYFHKTVYTVISDRIEAGTFLVLGALHNGITISNVCPKQLDNLLSLLKDFNCKINVTKNEISLERNETIFSPRIISLDPYPGLPTDLGPIISVLASITKMTTIITDNVYLKRDSHIKPLKLLGLSINSKDNITFINYKTKKRYKKRKTVVATDLRCCAALVLYASLFTKETIIKNIDYIFRGYEAIISKLGSIGIDMSVMK